MANRYRSRPSFDVQYTSAWSTFLFLKFHVCLQLHVLQLTNNGQWIRIIPSLSGSLYKFDGAYIDAIPITAESLLKSSFRYSEDLVIAGGLEVRTYGVTLHSGIALYECSSLNCKNTTDAEDNGEDVAVIERSTRTVRAIEPRTGIERWVCETLHI